MAEGLTQHCFMEMENNFVPNPRNAQTLNGFQDRRFQPLSHPSFRWAQTPVQPVISPADLA